MTEITEQPMPVPNDHTDIQSLVIADIVKRRIVGIKRYGTALQPFNGRDALRDAYEEALDLAIYLRQAIEERQQSAAANVTEAEIWCGDHGNCVNGPGGHLWQPASCQETP
jgi:hypothetical protein